MRNALALVLRRLLTAIEPKPTPAPIIVPTIDVARRRASLRKKHKSTAGLARFVEVHTRLAEDVRQRQGVRS